MVASAAATKRHALEQVTLRTTPLQLPYRSGAAFETRALYARLEDAEIDVRQRILAAMALSSRQRVASGHAIDFSCLDLGPAQIVLFPAEAFVGYQLIAAQMRPDAFISPVGYGECWPGYIPTAAAFDDGFDDTWLWVDPGCEPPIRAALDTVLA